MRPFEYRAATSLSDAVTAGTDAAFLAAGTEMVPALRDGRIAPASVIDLTPLGLDRIEQGGGRLRIGALARLSDIAAHAEVRTLAPALASAIDQSASAAIRSMGTLAGNLLQQVRCPYFRSEAPCNRRTPGAGCSVAHGDQRHAALFPLSFHCGAVHPSDPAVALAALDATLVVEGPGGSRVMPIDGLYPAAGSDPGAVSTLGPGDVIVAIECAAGSPVSRYVKIRDRASFDFALVSAAGGVTLENGCIVSGGLALGGIAWKPWRCRTAEARMIGRPWSAALVEEAVAAELAAATPLPGSRYKADLVMRAAVEALDPAGPS